MKMLDYDFYKFKQFQDKLIMVVNTKGEEYILFIKEVLQDNDHKYFCDSYFEIDVKNKKRMKARPYASFGHVFPEAVAEGDIKYFELDSSEDFHKTIVALLTLGE